MIRVRDGGKRRHRIAPAAAMPEVSLLRRPTTTRLKKSDISCAGNAARP